MSAELALILCHIRDVLCNGNEEHYQFVLNCWAQLVRQPERKLEVALVFIGAQGCGKSMTARLFSRIVDEYAQSRRDSDQPLKMVILDEPDWNDNEAAMLKNFITDSWFAVEAKGMNTQESRRNDWDLLIFSSSAPPAMLSDNRRFFVVHASDRRVGDHEYFAALHDGASQFLAYLVHHHQLPAEDWRPAAHLPCNN